MKIIGMALLALALTGCGAMSGIENPDRSSYFIVSEGGADGLSKLVTGGVQYCKVTQHNLGATAFNVTVTYDGESCLVEATTSDR